MPDKLPEKLLTEPTQPSDELPEGPTQPPDELSEEPTHPSDELSDAVVALTIAYRGTDFSGFARQEGQRTVQGELERALRTIYHREVATTGAGRTDTGVHALGNVVSFALTQAELDARSLEKLQSSLNALVGYDLVVKQIARKDAGFSARFSARAREYRYRLYVSPTPPLFLEPYVWWLKSGPLDLNAMKAAASYLEGEHDFKSFCVAKSADLGPTTRLVSRVMLFGAQHLGEQNLVVEVIGNAFLHSMVRVIVGSLVEVGLRKREPQWIGEVLAACDRQAAGQTAPAQGLTLWRVIY